MATEQEAVPPILDLMTGRWRSQVLHAGVALGIYDALSASQSLPAKSIAAEIGADEALLYRLMCASAGLDPLVEEEGARFPLSATGQLLSASHPQSLRSMVLHDHECRQILHVARESAHEDGRLLLMEWVVPRSNESHFAKLFDIHMLCVNSGRQRTRAEFETISAGSGWHVTDVLDVPHSPLAIVELIPA